MFNGSVAKLILIQSIFPPEMYTVYRSDRDCDTKLRGWGDLIAVSEVVFGVKRRPEFECSEECVWLEITVIDDRNLLSGSRYFPPDVKVDIIKITSVV
jgi:hypothetical protein